MRTSVCFYFQVHQPFRLRRDYSFFNIGTDHNYEDIEGNREIMQKIARNSYLPTNELLLQLIKKHRGKFKISFSISGMALEQFEKYAPEVIESYRALVKTGCVELLAETYYHSLAFVKSKEEFTSQVNMHTEKIKEVFGVTPTTFRNTELVYNNDLASAIEEMGFKTILAEGADRILKWRSSNFVYGASGTKNLKLLLKNYKLSDDIAFRFTDKNWAEYPLTAKKYAKWIHNLNSAGEVVNLFMDYETFGEHHGKDSGIFGFLSELPEQILSRQGFDFLTPSEVVDTYSSVGPIDVPQFTSWADEARDLSAWMGNDLQNSAMDLAYDLEKPIKQSEDIDLIHTWRKLLCSDHFYYASTKGMEDGAVHNYFSPYATPHEAFVVYSNVVNDLRLTLNSRGIHC
ncbi:MAG: glycoside hydrolase family 57 protein [Bacteriovoracaceae bacterium]|nr:glycoside hydrolase family 57 protein [Bacteriovoracaceae bacterium]